MSRRLAEGIPAPPPRPGREPVVAVIALGSNLGDRDATLDSAAAALARLPLVDEVRMSEPMESVAVRPEGVDPDAPGYLNAVALVSTRMAPSVLLGFLHAIEAEHGRERRERWGDRTLDLDLIAYGDVVSDDPALTLPHPRAAERDFVLGPWLAVDPDARMPGGDPVRALLDELQRETLVDGGLRAAGGAGDEGDADSGSRGSDPDTGADNGGPAAGTARGRDDQSAQFDESAP